MRKLGLSFITCVAFIAFTGIGGTALAAVDPSCDGDPYSNDVAIHDFSIYEIDSMVEHQVSGLTGSGLACGTDSSSSATLYDNARIAYPPGVQPNPTTGMENGRFVGTVIVNVASPLLGIVQNVESDLLIEQVSDADDTSFNDDCEDENPVGGDPPGTIITCYRGDNPIGYNHNYIVEGPGGELTLLIGPFHTIGLAGLTHIKQFNLCGYVGEVGGTNYPDDCGNSTDPFLQKNGDAAAPDCSNGKGIHTATATRRDGQTTNPVTTCVPWCPPRQLNPGPPRPWRPGGSAAKRFVCLPARSRPHRATPGSR